MINNLGDEINETKTNAIYDFEILFSICIGIFFWATLKYINNESWQEILSILGQGIIAPIIVSFYFQYQLKKNK